MNAAQPDENPNPPLPPASSSAKYVECECVECGWQDGFRTEAVTKGLIGGYCVTCNRESVFRVTEAISPNDQAEARRE